MQLLARARPLAIAAISLLLLALIPGMPKFAFFAAAGLLGAGAMATRKSGAAAEAAAAAPAKAADADDAPAAIDPLSVEIGYALVAVADEQQGGTLLNRVRAIRRQIATETGLVVPPVHVADNLQLGPRTYALLVKGVEVARGEIYLTASGHQPRHGVGHGRGDRDPRACLWPSGLRTPRARDAAAAAGFTVVDPTTAC